LQGLTIAEARVAETNIAEQTAQSNRPFVSLLSWKPVQRNSLRGFASVRLGRALKISDVAIHCSHGTRYVQLPSKPMIDTASGTILRNDKGKVRYVPLLEWLDKADAVKFAQAVIEAVEREHKGETEGEYGK
jgi:hypothetical protein